MEKKPITLGNLMTVAGAYLAFVIGAGFASGQEILQYFTVHGYGAFLALLLYCIVALLLNTEFIRTGQREQFEGQDGIYKYYCGKWLGTFYDFFAHLFLYSSFIVLLSGAGATFQQHYGVPTYFGVLLTAIIAGLAVTLGMRKVFSILGKVGPILIYITIIICMINIFTGSFSIRDGATAILDLDIMAASSTWYVSALNYLGFAIFWSAPFLSSFGKTLDSQKQAVLGQILAEFLLAITCLVVIIAMLTNINLMDGTQIPTLALGSNISPIFGSLFSIIIVLSIFSTAVPLLFLSAKRFVSEKTRKGKTTMIAMTIIAAVIALLLPFDQLMNYIYVANGYVGFVFVILVFIKMIRRKMVKDSKVSAQYYYENTK